MEDFVKAKCYCPHAQMIAMYKFQQKYTVSRKPKYSQAGTDCLSLNINNMNIKHCYTDISTLLMLIVLPSVL